MLTVFPVAPLITVPFKDQEMIMVSDILVVTLYCSVFPLVLVLGPDIVSAGMGYNATTTETLSVATLLGYPAGYTLADTVWLPAVGNEILAELPVAPLITVPSSDHAMVIGSVVLVVTLYSFVSPSVAVVEPDMVTIGVTAVTTTEILLVPVKAGYPVG